MKEINSYPKIYGLGHRAVRDIFKSPVVVQEKVDGSQISFMKSDTGELFVRSKNKMIVLGAPEKLFNHAITSISNIADLLTPGNVYRGEYLQKPKHNVLKYDRVPEGHIALFDIQLSVGSEHYLDPTGVRAEALYLGLDYVPTMVVNKPSMELIEDLMKEDSFLGGTKVEGLVFKNYSMFDQTTGKALMAKHVSEAFKEKMTGKKYNTTNKDVIQALIGMYRTEARWQKAVQAMREVGGLKDSPEDIGQLIKYVNHDVLEECQEEIQEALFKWAWKKISRGIIAGLPEWYKQKLLEKQFEEEGSDE